jgi:DUF3048 family protein
MMRRLGLAVVALALAATACSGSSGPAEPGRPGNEASPTPPPVAPLTGLPTSDASVLARVALAVKVENASDARPQAGLGRADVVYEEEVEGGITRFMAIFHSRDAPLIGPVRSVRLEDPDLAAQYRAALVYSGGAGHVVRAVENSGLETVTEDTPGNALYRRSSRRAPHNLYTSTARLRQVVGRGQGPPPAVFEYSTKLPIPAPTAAPTAAPSPQPGSQVTVKFHPAYVSQWRYRPARKVYVRYQTGAPHRLEDGSQIQARNVVVMVVRVRLSTHLDAAGNRTPEAIVTGSGQALLFRDGRLLRGRWSRRSLVELTTFATDTGETMTLAPGNTWIELVPQGRAITVL